jgi:heme/copper-type cytochrome/quinol oxidase subunit 2
VARGERVVTISAKRFELTPSKIVLHQGAPIVLELISLDRKHGFAAPELGIRMEATPASPARARVVPTKLGTFAAHCEVYRGEGHEEMTAEIVVVP